MPKRLLQRIPMYSRGVLENMPWLRNLYAHSSASARCCVRFNHIKDDHWIEPLSRDVYEVLEDQRNLSQTKTDNIFDSWFINIDALEKAFCVHSFPPGVLDS